MTGKERFFKATRFEETGRPPHFESMFELEHEAFGLRFPERTSWAGCSQAEKERKIETCLEIYERIIETYEWDALAVYWPWADPDRVAAAKKRFGGTTAIGGIVGGGVWSIDTISDWTEFAVLLKEEPQALHVEAGRRYQAAIDGIDRLVDAGADFVFVPCDVAFNGGPFVSPTDFAEIVTPYLQRQIGHARDRGVVTIFHSDGMLMPVLDQILACEPHVLHSIDPMAGMDIAEVKARTRGRMALMGNVQCSLLQDGPGEAIREAVLNCCQHASPGGGYIFSTSNTVFPGMPLKHYEYMLEVFRGFFG